MLIDYFLLTLRNLRRRGIRSWLTMLGIFIGIAAVVSLISLGEGLQTAVTAQFGALSTDTLTITNAETGFGSPGSTAVKKLTEHDLKIISSVRGVKMAIPRLVRIARIEYNKIARFFYIGSIPNNQEQVDSVYTSLDLKAGKGRLLSYNDKGKVVLGYDIANSEIFDKNIHIGTSINIQGKDFEVIGILKKSSTFQINNIILVTENDMKDILNIDDEIDLIVVKVQGDVEQVAGLIEKELRKDRGLKEGEEDFNVQTPIQALSTVNTILNIIKIVISGIAAISLLIGGVGIANAMFTSVLERTREIGVMKAIGAQNKDILLIFLIESAFLGLVGGIVGAFMGLGSAFLVSKIASTLLGENIIQVSLSVPLLVGAVSFSLLIGVLSGIVPAYQASKLNPVEALRA